jgi:DNA-binding PadR family transcriptional regulator
LRERDLRGYELVYGIGNLGFVAVRPGEVYGVLREAEAEGLVFSEREEAECILSRRRYGLTESGEAYLEFLSNALRAYRQEIETFFRAYEASPLLGVRG